MKRSRSLGLLVVFVVLLLMAGVGSWPQVGRTQTVPPLPAVHPLYGDCADPTNGTLPPAVFEPFLPNSIYVDWCSQAILTIAPPGVTAANFSSDAPGFDPAVGHRIGLFYNIQDDDDDDDDDENSGSETGWFIARYSYRVDFEDSEDLRERKIALLREICPLGNICNQLLIAKISKIGAEMSVQSVAGEFQIDQLNTKIFMPYVSKEQ